jgi:Flp pilus assembly protein TadB
VTRFAVLVSLVAFVGLVLVFAELPWVGRRSLTARLRPYGSSANKRSDGEGMLSIESFRDAIAPLAREIGRRASRLLGVHEDLGRRLERIHSTCDATQYRVRQLMWSGASFVAAIVVAAITRTPGAVSLLFVIGAPILAFLLLEQRVAEASAAWQRRITAELPVLTEQLGMLLAAGYSLGSALQRLSSRGRGACSTDLAVVCARIRHGLTEIEALREWADVADVDPLHRLVRVLALDREAADLSRLIADEARNIRRDAQRRLIETIERRTQQVWIPVTVAALVPGVIFLAIPFIRALSLFSNT